MSKDVLFKGWGGIEGGSTCYFPPGPVPIPDKGGDDIPKPKPSWKPVI